MRYFTESVETAMKKGIDRDSRIPGFQLGAFDDVSLDSAVAIDARISELPHRPQSFRSAARCRGSALAIGDAIPARRRKPIKARPCDHQPAVWGRVAVRVSGTAEREHEKAESATPRRPRAAEFARTPNRA